MKRSLSLVVLVLMTCMLCATSDAVPLKTEYPPPKTEGTPVPTDGLRLAPTQKRAWQFEVPEGSTNLARDKKVTGSDAFPLLGELSLITDGDKSADESSVVELAGGKQWVQIDLGKTAQIHALILWHYHLQERVYKAVVAQVSDDPAFAKDVKTVFNNDEENLNGLGKGGDFLYVETNYGKLINASGARGRYVRLYSNGNTSGSMNDYIEVEVWGR